MARIAFLFPGQGAQYIGMGKDFYDTYEVSKNTYNLASESSGLDVAKLCFKENAQINITEYTQIAMLTTEVAILHVILEFGIKPDVAAGLSLGEYGALATAGVMSDKELFSIIRKRGIFMQEAVPTGGAMSAVLGLDTETIEGVCESIEGQVSVANYNCPGQIVITGEEAAVRAAGEKLTDLGAKRVVPLKVSGPFHSPLLKYAGDRLAGALQAVTVNKPVIPYISNVTADYVTDETLVKDLLSRQVASPVCWQQSVEKMIEDGVDTFIEIGPGKTLSGFMKKINREVTVMNIEKVEDLEKLESIK